MPVRIIDRIRVLSRQARSPYPKGGRLPSGLPSRENLGQLTQGDKQTCQQQKCPLVRLPTLHPTGIPSTGRRSTATFVGSRRVSKAVREGRWNKVKALVYLLTHSFSGRALAILRVI